MTKRQFVLKDSGTRHRFSTGAVRDTSEGKGRYDLLPVDAIRRLAIVFERGAKKYADRNWEKGINVCRFLDSGQRHLGQALRGDTDEDHLGQAAWNVMCAIQTLEWIEAGILPESLDDIPRRVPRFKRRPRSSKAKPASHRSRTKKRNQR